jgi:uncharacterized protein YegL
MTNMVNLQKEAKVVLVKKEIFGELANVIGVMDISPSMDTDFSNGTVQQTFERLLGVGMNLDANKSIEVFAFNHDVQYVGEANESNIENFTNNVFLKKVRISGGTWYTPAMKEVVKKVESENEEKGFFKKLFARKNADGFDKDLPTLVFFVTDGANHWDDHGPAKAYLREISNKPIFWQFVGIGRSSMPFLEELDTMEGRVIDNANFFRAEDIKNIPYSGLLDKILNEFPSWLKEAREQGIVKPRKG